MTLLLHAVKLIFIFWWSEVPRGPPPEGVSSPRQSCLMKKNYINYELFGHRCSIESLDAQVDARLSHFFHVVIKASLSDEAFVCWNNVFKHT